MTTLEEPGFGDFRKRVFQFYEEKRFKDALAVAREASKQYPDYDAKTAFWISCLQNRLGNHSEAIQTLQNAVKRGVWWRNETLQDADLNPIRGTQEFLTIEEDCKRLQLKAAKTDEAELMVQVPAGYRTGKNWPALVVLHARYGERPDVSAEEWLPILSTGTILAAPWSSQVYASDGRCWDDWELSERDVRWTFKSLNDKYSLDLRKLALGGFSQGAALSIYSTLKKVIPSRGFVAVAPSDWVRPEEKRATERVGPSEPFASFVKASDCRGLRGVIMIGDRDPFFPKIAQLHDLMVERGLDGKLEVEKDLGHEYPKDFGNRLHTAFDYVIGN